MHLLDNGDRLIARTGRAARVEPQAVACGTVYLDDRPETVEPRSCASGASSRRRASWSSSSARRATSTSSSRGVAADEAELAGEVVARGARRARPRHAARSARDPEWLRAEIAIAAKRACRRALGLRPVIVPVVV